MSTLLFTISTGVPSEKLVLGIATYGLSFLLENEDHYLIGDKISGQGLPGHITNTTGILASYEVNNKYFFPQKDLVFNLDLRTYRIGWL
jgi:spore germination protein YaaH